MTFTLATCSPVKVNSTVLAVQDVGFAPNVAEQLYRHSDNQFGSIITVFGAAPIITLSTPFKDAYDLFGLGILDCTTVEIYLAQFSAYAKAGITSHTKYSLAASAHAIGSITGFSVSQGGVALAQVTLMLISADGMTHPLTRTTGQTLPNVAAEPALHTVGPLQINGTKVDGVTSLSGQLGMQISTPTHDGELYPRNGSFLTADPMLSLSHNDPVTLGGILGTIGVNASSNIVAYMRGFSGNVASTGGISITVANGRAQPETISTPHGSIATSGLRILSTSANDTHPWAVNTGATMP